MKTIIIDSLSCCSKPARLSFFTKCAFLKPILRTRFSSQRGNIIIGISGAFGSFLTLKKAPGSIHLHEKKECAVHYSTILILCSVEQRKVIGRGIERTRGWVNDDKLFPLIFPLLTNSWTDNANSYKCLFSNR